MSWPEFCDLLPYLPPESATITAMARLGAFETPEDTRTWVPMSPAARDAWLTELRERSRS